MSVISSDGDRAFLCWRAAAPFRQGRWVDGRCHARMLGQQVGVLSHAIAGALDLDDQSVVKKAVEQRGGHHRIAKDITPFGEPRLDVRIMAPFS